MCIVIPMFGYVILKEQNVWSQNFMLEISPWKCLPNNHTLRESSQASSRNNFCPQKECYMSPYGWLKHAI